MLTLILQNTVGSCPLRAMPFPGRLNVFFSVQGSPSDEPPSSSSFSKRGAGRLPLPSWTRAGRKGGLPCFLKQKGPCCHLGALAELGEGLLCQHGLREYKHPFGLPALRHHPHHSHRLWRHRSMSLSLVWPPQISPINAWLEGPFLRRVRRMEYSLPPSPKNKAQQPSMIDLESGPDPPYTGPATPYKTWHLII